MICPSCQRDNEPRRRYCGKCGCNFEPACGGCGFANGREDRYCGGCGSLLAAVAAHASPSVAAPAAARAAHGPPQPAGPAPVVDELAGLFAQQQQQQAAAELPELPAAGIEQADLDRLFGNVQ